MKKIRKKNTKYSFFSPSYQYFKYMQNLCKIMKTSFTRQKSIFLSSCHILLKRAKALSKVQTYQFYKIDHFHLICNTIIIFTKNDFQYLSYAQPYGIKGNRHVDKTTNDIKTKWTKTNNKRKSSNPCNNQLDRKYICKIIQKQLNFEDAVKIT